MSCPLKSFNSISIIYISFLFFSILALSAGLL
jgi:hypothetical protein